MCGLSLLMESQQKILASKVNSRFGVAMLGVEKAPESDADHIQPFELRGESKLQDRSRLNPDPTHNGSFQPVC